MAYTLSKALGFLDMNDNETILDIDESAYPDEIYNVIRAKVMNLDGGKFYPTENIKEEDVETAKKKIDYWLSSDNEEIKEHDDSKLKEDVKDFRDFNDYELTNNSDAYELKLNDNLPNNESLKIGDKVVMGRNDNNTSMAFCITKVKGENKYECKKLDITDIYSKIDMATNQFYISHDSIKTSEGVSVNYQNNSLKKSRIGGSTDLLKDSKFSVDLGKGIKLSDNIKLAGKTTITIPDITAQFNADIKLGKMDIKSFQFSVSQQIKLNGGLYLTNNENCTIPYGKFEDYINDLANSSIGTTSQYRKELFQIKPKTGLYGLVVRVFAEVSANGEISVGMTIDSTEGIKYKDGVLRNLSSKKVNINAPNISGKGYMDFGVAFDFDILNFSVFGITFQGGRAYDISLVTQLTYEPLVCANVTAYPELKITLDKETIIGEFWSKQKHCTFQGFLIGKDNSKGWKMGYHMENYHFVDKCTYGQGNINGHVLYAENDSPVEKAQIEVYCEGSQNKEIPIKTVYTDKFGYYKIENLPVGKYDIKVKVTNCEQTIIKNVEVEKEKTTTIDDVKVGKRIKRIKANSIALGNNYSAAIKEDGSLWMWGDNRFKQISDDITTDSISKPRKIMTDVKSVSLGSVSSAAIKSDGSLWLWGTTILDEILELPKSESYKPHKIMENVKSVCLGGSTGAAIKEDGSLWMWGENSNGKLGDGTIERSLVPKKIMESVKMVSLSGGNHSAAIKEDGSLWTWGWNGYGQLGDGEFIETHKPKKVMEKVKAVSLGGNYSAVIKNDDSLWMWGMNYCGQLGDENIYSIKDPQKIAENVREVKLSDGYGAFITQSGVLWCLGRNSEGQLGDGTTVNSSIAKEVKFDD